MCKLMQDEKSDTRREDRYRRLIEEKIVANLAQTAVAGQSFLSRARKAS